MSRHEETASPVIDKTHKPCKTSPDPLYGRYECNMKGRKFVVQDEPDSELRASKQVPLVQEGVIEAFIRREVVQPYMPERTLRAE